MFYIEKIDSQLIPMLRLSKQWGPPPLTRKRRLLKQKMAEAGNSIYGSAINTPLMKQFFAHTVDPYIADAQLLTDDPDKLLEKLSDETQIVVNKMREILTNAEKRSSFLRPISSNASAVLN